jgi:nucleoside-diphosphate-sugar epimerase
MWHHSPPSAVLADARGARLVQADLGDEASLVGALKGAEVAIHMAGRLFAPRAPRFLPVTNVVYMDNLVRAAVGSGLSRLVFVSFPQVEGPSSPKRPSLGRLEGRPVSEHARTRLEAERRLFTLTEGTPLVPVVIRSGVVYGRKVKLIEAARRLMALRLLAVWRSPTWFHFIALPDFVRGLEAALTKPGLHGIYPLGDDLPITLQSFLDRTADWWGYPRPWRLPVLALDMAALTVESLAVILHSPAPLTRDILRLARVNHAMDTTRMKAELDLSLEFPTLKEGLAIL